MQRSLDAGAVVVAELPNVAGDMLEIGSRHQAVGEEHLASRHPSLRLPAEVQHDLEQLARIGALVQGARQIGRQRFGEELDLLIPLWVLCSRGDLARYTSF